MTTKRDIILAALGEIGIASYDFDIQPEQMLAAMGQLDRMVSSWSMQGITLPYLQGSTDPDDDIRAWDWAHEALVLNLAIRLGPSYGRSSPPETTVAGARAIEAIRSRIVVGGLTEVQLDSRAVPTGAGSRYSRVFLPKPVDTLPISDGLTLIIGV